MNITQDTDFSSNVSLLSVLESTNPCPKQRNIMRPLLIVHNYALLFFGSVFNFVAFFILMHRSLRRHSTFAYLAFLSFSNGLLSLAHFSKWMLKYYFNMLFDSYLLTCRFQRFSFDFLTHFSSYTLVFVNIDRARAVTRNQPTARFPKSKFRKVFIRESLVAMILFIFHFHWIVKYGSEVTEGNVTTTICTYEDIQPNTIYFHFLSTIYPPLELIVFVCFPFLINILCTILIVRSLSNRIRRAKKFQTKKLSKDRSSNLSICERLQKTFLPSTTSQSSIHSCFCWQCQCRRHTRVRIKLGNTKESLVKYEEENQKIDQNYLSVDKKPTITSSATQTTMFLNKQHKLRRTRDINLSALLIGLNLFYLCLNLPFNLYQALAKKIYPEHSQMCDLMFTGVLLDTLQQTFFSTNFFLYILTNRRFREEFYATFIRIFPSGQKLNQAESPKPESKYPLRQSSCNPSSINLQANLNSDYQLNVTASRTNRDSFYSDVDYSDVGANGLTSIDVNPFAAKLLMFRKSLDHQ